MGCVSGGRPQSEGQDPTPTGETLRHGVARPGETWGLPGEVGTDDLLPAPVLLPNEVLELPHDTPSGSSSPPTIAPAGRPRRSQACAARFCTTPARTWMKRGSSLGDAVLRRSTPSLAARSADSMSRSYSTSRWSATKPIGET